jgi:hypothetical protein
MPLVSTGHNNKPHAGEATHEVLDLLTRITVDHQNNIVADQSDWSRAVALCRSLTGYVVNGPCADCRLACLDRLRALVGLGPARRPVSDERHQQRLAVCHACPVYHPDTGSCGRLIVDAITPRQVEVGGRIVTPCGCVVALKARFKSEHCPGNFWPLK